MLHLRSIEKIQVSLSGRAITRRAVFSALMLAALAACGRKGPLELPPEDDEEDGDNPEPDSVEDPDTYGDPMTFPEPGEDEESAE
jgi:predicted small lipoprotein YifL